MNAFDWTMRFGCIVYDRSAANRLCKADTPRINTETIMQRAPVIRSGDAFALFSGHLGRASLLASGQPFLETLHDHKK